MGRFFACMVRLREQYLGGSWQCKIAGALRRAIGEPRAIALVSLLKGEDR